VTFDDAQAGHGPLGYGRVEWVRAGRGMWHEKELSAGTSKTVGGFQLRIALPPDLVRCPCSSNDRRIHMF
jgi:redox-sensitive bicupin YhaK (pirin superfamily)